TPVRVTKVLVACVHPMPFKGRLRLLVLFPIAGRGAVARDHQRPDVIRRQRDSIIADDLRRIARHFDAGSAGAARTRTVRQKHVTPLRGTDTVDDLEADSLVPPA